MPALLVAAFFAFLTSFDDVVYVLFLGIGHYVAHAHVGGNQAGHPTIAAVATLQMVFAAAVIVLGTLFGR